MPDISINYKGNSIATMDASGTTTLHTSGKYCESDISVIYDKPSAPVVNCKIFNFISETAVANADVTVVRGDADVAAHYADANAMVVVRKVTNNDSRGTAMIVGTNHAFGVSTSMYMNYNGSSNAAAVTSVPLTATSGSGVSVRCNANGDIIVHCLSMNNNFGGAEYIIMFSW